ncbi:HAD family hydrolase [Evansella halocellulosilytica]|uniref:HAD family hydrolase n=1 Tax=Evansella halocellulosilytica TaxID=2011013 RepID=UPI000BB998BB|nr:HAD family hydrolase [Evansella halocellulosilytica]
MIKAVIFDCDGLIVDTETPWYKAFKAIYQDYEIDLPLELYAQCIGNTTQEEFDPHIYLEAQSRMKIDKGEMENRAKQLHSEMMTDEKLRPGVKNYLQAAKNAGLKIGLASSSDRDWIDYYLKKYNLVSFFDTIQTGDTVEVVKPHPELYENAIKALDVEPHEAVAFEDSVNGLVAAKSAGLKCVIVPNEATSVLTFDNYDLRLSSMEEKNFEGVMKTILAAR